MKSTRKKLFAVLLSAALLLSSMTVFAAGDNVAKAGETEYATLQAAINEANGQEVVLIANTTEDIVIAQGSTVTLNLGGYTLTNKSGHTITNNGTLTITGSGTVDNVTHTKGALVNNGTAVIDGGVFTRSKEAGISSGSGGNSWYVIDNHGTLTVKSGEIRNTSGFSSLVRNINATMNVEGGTFSNAFIALKNDDNGIMNITGGDITTTSAEGSALQNWGSATISGGTLNAPNGGAGIYASTWDPQYSSSTTINEGAVVNGSVLVKEDEDASEGTPTVQVVMNGGTLTGNINVGTNSNVSLTNGTVKGSVTKINEADTSSIIKISGGIYETKPNSSYITDGQAAIGIDGTYYVGTLADMKAKAEAVLTAQTVDVLKGIKELDINTDGVVVINNTGADIKVNGVAVKTGDDEAVTTVVHDLEYVPEKAATATEAGNKAYWKCTTHADEYFWDENAENQIQSLDETIIPATGEPQKPTDSTNQTKPSTTTKNPSGTNQKTKAPRTGDTSQAGAYLLLAVLALGAGGFAVKRKISK